MAGRSHALGGMAKRSRETALGIEKMVLATDWPCGIRETYQKQWPRPSPRDAFRAQRDDSKIAQRFQRWDGANDAKIVSAGRLNSDYVKIIEKAIEAEGKNGEQDA